jgi:3',5'-cyclic AMP phosphodiesterase CpdA
MLFLPVDSRADYAPFAIVSDTHVGAKNSVYSTFIKHIDEQKIGVIIHAGDAIHTRGSVSQWARFLEITGPGRRLHIAPGNHDIRGKETLDVFLSLFSKPYHSFSEGDTLFVLLNTELPGEEFKVTNAQLEWLKGELERPFQHKFIFLHQPLFPVLFRHGLHRDRAARDSLHRLFVQHGVSLVVSGHDHIYKRMVKEGVTYVITGGGGGRLPLFAGNGNYFRYLVSSRTFDGYSFVVRDVKGTARDVFWVTR